MSDTMFRIPFPYLKQNHIKVYIDDNEVPQSGYFVMSSELRFIVGYPDAKTVTIKRVTDVSPDSGYSLMYAVEELLSRESQRKDNERDNLTKITSRIAESRQYNEDFTSAMVAQAKKEASEELARTDSRIESTFGDYASSLISHYALVTKRFAELEEQTGAIERGIEVKSSANKAVEQAIYRRMDEVKNGILSALSDMSSRLADVETKLQSLENKPAPMAYSAPITVVADTSIIEKELKETRSALNIETQVRRREDAQIKAILKRLLDKFERLEDYIAGTAPDFPDSILADLRKESRLHDDKLGRTALELTIRVETLKELHK